jgi:predicted transcriptional regulator of viral defense system
MQSKMAKQIPGTYPEKLTRASAYLAGLLESAGKPVLTQFEFFRVIWRMYQLSTEEKLYLRHDTPNQDDYSRLRLNLKKTGFIGADRDYGARIIRVLTVSDLPAEEIVCLVDPTCYVSHLSAMQRWGLTDRTPGPLLLTRPDRKTAQAFLQKYMDDALYDDEENPFPLKVISHPKRVRSRPVSVYETKTYGAHIQNRGSEVRVSTIGQTFLDMLQKPDLCGGMAHVLDVWREHAATYLDEIVTVVDAVVSGLVKSRAGYIIEEYLGLDHPNVDQWKALGQRGGSRKLDPSKEFAPTFSETWMISLNV